jgi:hypothetical protein
MSSKTPGWNVRLILAPGSSLHTLHMIALAALLHSQNIASFLLCLIHWKVKQYFFLSLNLVSSGDVAAG